MPTSLDLYTSMSESSAAVRLRYIALVDGGDRATHRTDRSLACMLAWGLCYSFCTSKVMTSVLVDPVTIATMSALVGY